MNTSEPQLCQGSTAERGIGVIVVRYGMILVSQRIKDGALTHWQCPGGHIEANEHCLQAAARELKEEAGLNLETSRFLPIFHDKKSVGFKGQEYQACAYIVPARNYEHPVNLEPDKHTEWVWMEPTKFARLNVLPRTVDALFNAFKQHTELFIPNGSH